MKYIKKILVFVFLYLAIFITNVYAKDLVITIDPGHGGDDVGALNKSAGIIERDINLKIARYLKQYLEEYGNVKVIMTHNGFASGKLELLDRALVGRNNNADLFISIHCNASSTSNTVHGAEAYVTANKSLPKYNQECSKLANMILDNISKLGIKKIGVKTRLSGLDDEVYTDGTRADYYGVIRYSMKGVEDGPGANIQNGEGVPAVLVEHCYIQNGDEKYINNEQGLKNLARADCDAIVQYYGLRIKEKTVSSVSLDIQNKTLAKGDSINLNATIYPETAEDKKIIWSTSNEKIAKVDNGKVTAISEGEATITAKTNDGGYTAECKIIVKKLDISINNDKIYALQGEKTKLIYNVEPYLPAGYKCECNISDENTVSLDNQNIITSKKVGESNLTIKILDSTSKVVAEKKVDIKVSKLEENEFIKIENYKEENGILTKINPQTLKADFVKNITVSDGLEVTVNSEKISTGTQVIVKRKAHTIKEEYEEVTEEPNEENKEDDENTVTTPKTITKYREIEVPEEIIKTYSIVIYGDVNGDGEIDAIDLLRVRRFLLGKDTINNYCIEAADVYIDEEIDAKDLLKIRRYLLGKDTINV